MASDRCRLLSDVCEDAPIAIARANSTACVMSKLEEKCQEGARRYGLIGRPISKRVCEGG